MVSYRYAPEIYPHAFRWSTIAEHWAGQGHQVDVVCASKPGLPGNEVINGVRVHRVGGSLINGVDGLRSLLRGAKDPSKKNISSSSKSSSKDLTRSLLLLSKKVHDNTWKKVYWPDYAGSWYFPAVRKLKQLFATHSYDGLVSVSHPFTGHLAGLGAMRQNLRATWVVDVGDPFCFVEDVPANNRRLYKGLNCYAEGKVFDRAAAIAVTPEAAKKYKEIFPENAAKMQIIPPLLAAVQDEEAREPVFMDANRLRLVFIGTLYKDIRNPDFLLKLFAALLQTPLAERLELHFFGDINDCKEFFEPYRELLGNKIFIHGMVSRGQAMQAMREADILVNIANDTPYQLPSKVVEYASTGKPVLNLARIPDDSSTSFFDAYPAALSMIVSTEAPTTEQCDKLVRFIGNLPPAMQPAELQEWLKPFQVESIAATYERLLTTSTAQGA